MPNNRALPPIKKVQPEEKGEAHSSSALSINSRNRQRIPQVLLSALRGINEGEEGKEEGMKKSKIGGMMRSGFKSMRNKLWQKK